MNVRLSTPAPWPHPTEVFALTVAARKFAAAGRRDDVRADQQLRDDVAGVGYGYRKIAKEPSVVADYRAAGRSFVSMQAFEWTKLITRGASLGNRWARPSSAPASS